ncbi:MULTISPECIES: hypothetical protein [unclassified Pseudomonas]|jgi:hypothetical protein|uniref:hypothetical protein n=1 Tax=unclassified Pseudomonas TaxID=196821 RepID=UPI00096B8089|nr:MULTISPECIES: hypothetical protein [unclassified Pseudomonas]MDY0834398.1 hypothetical protein [Pseudomonas sp. SED1]NIL16889.1 hypothetical protein [Pseudomonas sp. AN3A02]OLY75107.1 hypothetical protein AU074_06565 [Pseudomonas sp. ATCC PTA-122608]
MVKLTPVDDLLPVPTVKYAAANNTLYPLDAEDGTCVTIAFDGMQEGAPITLYWALVNEQDQPLAQFDTSGSASGSVEVDIDAALVGRCIGKTLMVWYETTTSDSHVLELTIEFIRPEALPAPVFTNAVEYDGARWLDMRKFRGNARIELKAPPFLAEGQRLWILAVGNEHDLGNFRFQWLFDGHVVRAEEAEPGFVFRPVLSREWLAGCEDWSSVTLNVAITYDGALGAEPADPKTSLLPENAHELRRVTENLRLGESEAPAFDDESEFEGGNWNGWERGADVVDPRDMVMVNEGGEWFLSNYTYTERSAGVVLSKSYPAFAAGQTYEFSMEVRRSNSSFATPQLSALVNGVVCIEPSNLTTRQWAWVSGTFTATGSGVEVQVYSHVSTGNGNDYAFGKLRLREL